MIMAVFMPNQTETQLAIDLKRIISLYPRAGFIIQTILLNMEFIMVITEISEVIVSISTASDHMAKVER